MTVPTTHPGTEFTWERTLRAWWVDCLTCGGIGIRSSLIDAARLATSHHETEHGPRTFGGAPFAVDRPETDTCERSTYGCCVRHLPGQRFDCECW